MSVGGHLRTIWRHRWSVLALAIATGVVVYIAGSLVAKTYSASAEINVVIPSTPATGQATQDQVLFTASTYAQLATAAPVVEAAARQAGLGLSERQAAARLAVTPSSTVGIINITAQGPTAAAAVALDRAESHQLLRAAQAQQKQALRASEAPIQQQISAIDKQLRQLPSSSPEVPGLQQQLQTLDQELGQVQLQPSSELLLVSSARPAPGPISPRPKTWALLGFLTALVLGAEGVAAYQALSGRFSPDNTEEQLRRLTALPVLARIPAVRHPRWFAQHPGDWWPSWAPRPAWLTSMSWPPSWIPYRAPTGQGRDSESAEAFRALRARMRYTADGFQARTWAVLEPEAGDGASQVAAGLAQALAEMDVPVLLVEADLRHPGLARRLGVADRPGLSDALSGAPLDSCMRAVPTQPALYLMPAGAPTADPAGAISERLEKTVLTGLVDREHVVVDTPPWARFPDAMTVGVKCDAAVLVVNASRSRRCAVESTLEQIDQLGIGLVGIVVTGADRVHRDRLRTQAPLPTRSR
jgi:Mrp family chromosome partitioning ATPase/capsular polysaccharide biosynthesis protein